MLAGFPVVEKPLEEVSVVENHGNWAKMKELWKLKKNCHGKSRNLSSDDISEEPHLASHIFVIYNVRGKIWY